MRRFALLGGHDAIPDETARVHCRRVLETHQLAAPLFFQANAHLASKGLRLRSGTIGAAPRIAAPCSTTKRSGQRDAQLHQTTTGNQWSFGMTAHRGVDDTSGLVHHVHCTAAHVADVTQGDRLLHGEEDTVGGDSGYTCRLACFALRAAQDRPSIGAAGVKTSGMHPALRLLIDRLPWRKISGKHSPRCAGADNPTQGVEHHPQTVLTLWQLGIDHCQIGCVHGPCVICNFSGIRSGFSD